MFHANYVTCLLVSIFVLSASAQTINNFDPGLAPFSIVLNDTKVSHKTTFRTLLPGETLNIKVLSTGTGEYSVLDRGRSLPMRENKLRWKAPEVPGHYPISVRGSNEEIRVQIFVMQPAGKVANGKLNGYDIGGYPVPFKGLDIYKAPRGFIELTEGMEKLEVSPHFTLGQFLCKQKSGYPKYLVLRPRLLEKLEFLLEEVNRQGIRTDSFVVMSGYRTPFYNRAIKNVTNSRHIFGGAADIYIDVSPIDGVMDDLDGDGRISEKDAAFLYKIVEKLELNIGREDLFGGIGNYNATSAHGPFVHVDVRGTRARWGL